MEFTHTQADVDAAKNAGSTEGQAAGRKAERARFAAILNCEEAKGRGTLALQIASETELEPDQAKKLLAAAPLENNGTANPLAAAMAGVPNPNVGAGAGGDTDEAAEAAKTVAAYRAAMGVTK